MCFENIDARNVKFVCDEGFVYLKFNILEEYETKFIHAFTTRIGGVSEGNCATLNLGFQTGDAYEDVMKNYKILGDKFHINVNNIVFSKQVHEDKVRIVTEEDTKNGFGTRDSLMEFDAMVTDAKNVVLMAFFADCVPVFFYDPVKNVVGIAHSGWRGTVKNISSKVIDALEENYGSKAADIKVAIGPSIGYCCFEISEDVYLDFKKVFNNENNYRSVGNGKYNIDLWSIITENLIERGLRENNIVNSNICTKCNTDVFFSYRGQGGSTGRLAGLISII
jgi:YfiH family protein